tara:strand:+ start:1383 stop:1529 length:147 start_codon:yes stop_codon:yes gene_type:complete
LVSKLRVKLRVTFSELFVEEYRKIELVGRSVARPPQCRAYLIRLSSEC